MKPDMLCQRLRKLLQGPLPGAAAHAVMSPRPSHNGQPHGKARPLEAGVLLLLYPRNAELYTVLTLRTAEVATHRSQMSLPGGRKENAETTVEAALRESQEELGVPPDSVTLLGCLTPLLVRASNHLVYPVVGYSRLRPRFVPNPKEVDQVVEVSLKELCDPCAMKRETRTLAGGETRDVPFYALKGHAVWGATAMILSEFLAVLRLA